MDSELENKAQDLSTEQNESTREGYSRPTGGYTNNYQGSGRPQRPRIHNQRAYTTDHNDSENEGGFRPEGFGSALQNGDPACKVATEGRNKEAIGLASTAILTTHKAAISPDSKAVTVVRKVVTTTIAAATTTTAAVMASKVATTTAEVTTIVAVMGVRKAAITTTMATTIGRATTQMRNIASKNALNTKKSTLILTSRYA